MTKESWKLRVDNSLILAELIKIRGIIEENNRSTIPIENNIIIKRYSSNSLGSPLLKKFNMTKYIKQANQPTITKRFDVEIIPIKLEVIIIIEF